MMPSRRQRTATTANASAGGAHEPTTTTKTTKTTTSSFVSSSLPAPRDGDIIVIESAESFPFPIPTTALPVVRRGGSPTSDHSRVPNHRERRPLARDDDDRDDDDDDDEDEDEVEEELDDGGGNVIMAVVAKKRAGCLDPAPHRQHLSSMLARAGFLAFPLFVLFGIARDARSYYYLHGAKYRRTTGAAASPPRHEDPASCPGMTMIRGNRTKTTNATTAARNDDGEDDDEEEDEPTTTTTATAAAFGGLRAIVTGLEHSGTTLAGSLLINAPCVMGAFETGYLLAAAPRDIEGVDPWFRWNYARTDTLDVNYRLTAEDVEMMKNAEDFAEMYDVLRNRSYLFNELNDDDDDDDCARPTDMIDKTPLYVYPIHLKSILKKTPGVPVIVTKKEYDKLEKSWRMRNSTLTREFYDETFDNVCRMMEEYPGRILIVHEEELMSDPDGVMTGVFEHVGLVWKSEYLRMTGLLKKFSNDTRTSKRIEEWIFKPGKHNPDRTDRI